MRTIINTTSGSPVPVTVDLHVQPLMLEKREIFNGHGKKIMNDQWIYIQIPHYGDISINVNRANYCTKIYLSQVKILESIDGQPTENLKRFINTVSDRLVFQHKGTTYRVFLQKDKNKFDILAVKPYWGIVPTGGIGTPNTVGGTKTFKTSSWNGGNSWMVQEKKYGHMVSQGSYQGVDLKETFGFEYS